MSILLARTALRGTDDNVIAFFWIVFGGLTFVVHLVSAFTVYRDGHALRMEANRRNPGAPGTVLIPPEIWALATLLMGVFTLGLYWFLHHSTIVARPDGSLRQPPDAETPPPA